MKKIIALLLILTTIFAMAVMTSCEKETKEEAPKANEEVAETVTEPEATEPETSEENSSEETSGED